MHGHRFLLVPWAIIGVDNAGSRAILGINQWPRHGLMKRRPGNHVGQLELLHLCQDLERHFTGTVFARALFHNWVESFGRKVKRVACSIDCMSLIYILVTRMASHA